ncbi:hypothetical protein TSC_c03310 [Thermus scotoductus SA-01]|uniref:Uncharacterized protein n=1 Tax=Thermus scotoductus (strain ATCC 700910 / SA-01) TaxID=743525 RepID=E8PKS6_THESS|nr:hypothetical protein TSC_c03310 [Thermus scotoductus SA-01]
MPPLLPPEAGIRKAPAAIPGGPFPKEGAPYRIARGSLIEAHFSPRPLSL